ncbi:hypothetical protein D8798_01020 [Streptococcus cristatus]|uniref:Uncharacterized protein n=1 Tax=Streptococcus cristatus TaxID=45634 RepID=A0A428GJQ3_STRCR|nr:hypothetical protein [Streptococcus cristatus]RSJ77740.1 hypothetical protein D8798_01020 [Streptococcus cristatus]
MDETIKSKLAIEIASKSLRIATLEAHNEELQAQLQQALDRNAELEKQLQAYEPRAEEAPESEVEA